MRFYRGKSIITAHPKRLFLLTARGRVLYNKAMSKIRQISCELKDYIWGGSALTALGFGKAGDRVAEAWAVSFHADGMSRVMPEGEPIADFYPRECWGKEVSGDKFPVLVKFIDSADNLSVQVHPSDEQSDGNGKNEMWYVMDCASGAGLYVGLKKSVTADELRRSIADGSVTSLLNFIPVKKGDCYYIPAGTVHAIGKGCMICEIQQTSNITYRLYDYGRLGADGKPRELHVERGVEVSCLEPYQKQEAADGYVLRCPYFAVKKINGAAKIHNEGSFTSVTVLGGSGKLVADDRTIRLKAGVSVFVPAGEACEVSGSAECLCVTAK